MNQCREDFEKKHSKGKYVVVCAQRPKVDDLYGNMTKFDTAFEKMCESSKEYQGEFQIQYKPAEFPNNFKELLNHHVQISFPGLENGFFPGVKKFKT